MEFQFQPTVSKLEQLLTAGADRKTRRSSVESPTTIPVSTELSDKTGGVRNFVNWRGEADSNNELCISTPLKPAGKRVPIKKSRRLKSNKNRKNVECIKNSALNEFSLSEHSSPNYDDSNDESESSQNAQKLENQSMKKNDREHMQAEIEKLINMSSSSNSKKNWKKPSARQRRHQCSQCSKSYSSEDDLKSHELSHNTDGSDNRPFACDECDKKFKWSQSLKVHKRRFHSNDDEEDDSNGEAEEESDMKLKNDDEEEEELDISNSTNKKKIRQTAASPIAKSARIANANARKALTKDDESVSVNGETEVGTVLPSNDAEDLKKAPDNSVTRRYSEKKIQKLDDNHPKPVPPKNIKQEDTKEEGLIGARKKRDSKSSDDPPRKMSMNEEIEEVPRDQTNGRASLRRNIQRPKWLTDADLVTDYEFPRGTNSARTGSASSTPITVTIPSVVVNGKQSQTESAKETPKITNKANNKPKPKARPPRIRSRDVRTSESKQKESIKRSVQQVLGQKLKKAKLSVHSVSEKNNLPTTKKGENDKTTTKQLSTKILSRSLDEGSTKSSFPSPKNSRKRPAKSLPDSKSNEKDSRKRQLRPKRQKIEGTPSAVVKPKELKDTSKGVHPILLQSYQVISSNMSIKTFQDESTSAMSESVVADVKEELDEEEESTTADSVAADANVENLVDQTDSKKLEEPTVECDITNLDISIANTEIVETGNNENIIQNESEETIPSMAVQHINETKTLLDPSSATTASVDDEVNHPSTDCSSNEKEKCFEDSTLETNTTACNRFETPPLSTLRFVNNANFVSFADIASGSNNPTPQNTTQNLTEEESMDIDNSIDVPLPLPPNDEEMPVLKPQTSSSVSCAEINSDCEHTKCIDDEFSSNSNQSTIPPALAKEPTYLNERIRLLSNSQTSDLEDFPLGKDSDVLGSRKLDRSDSLSMTSCESGSQSEKIKSLEDNAESLSSKRNEIRKEVSLDSDSNDSLMTEFSELAAQVTEKTDGIKFKEDCLRFITTKVSANSMWAIRKELKKLKKDKNYFKFGKLSPLAAVLMHDLFCQSLS